MTITDDDLRPRRGEAAADPHASDAEQRKKFARAMARAEFGRFYWNDDLADQVRRSMARRVEKPKADKR